MPKYFTEKQMTEVIERCTEVGSWSQLNKYLGIFFTPEAVMHSFPFDANSSSLKTNSSCKEVLRLVEHEKDLDEQVPAFTYL